MKIINQTRDGCFSQYYLYERIEYWINTVEENTLMIFRNKIDNKKLESIFCTLIFG